MNTSRISVRWPAIAAAAVAGIGLVAVAPPAAHATAPPGGEAAALPATHATAPPGATAQAAPVGQQAAAVSTAKTVTNVHNRGAGSLRAAIWKVNNPALRWDTILFDIPGIRPQVIRPTTDLPALTAPVTIDGYSQRFASPATRKRPAKMMIVIDAAGLSRGLELDTNRSTVSGLTVTNADAGLRDGFVVHGNHNTLTGNYVGVGASGTTAAGNLGDGVSIEGNYNTFGGSRAADRNVVSGNGNFGLRVGGDHNVLLGNRVGTDAAGMVPMGNGNAGIDIEGDHNLVGGRAPTAGNLVSDNRSGVAVESGTANEVRGNLVGTDAAGLSGLGNGGTGVDVDGDDVVVSGNLVGDNFGSGIEIRGNGALLRDNQVGGNTDAKPVLLPNRLDGIMVSGDGATIGGAVLGNVVIGNGADGIDVFSGAEDVIEGNFVGVDKLGSRGLGNGADGISMRGSDSVVGGVEPRLENVVSGNGDDGIDLSGDGNQVEYNLVGTDQSRVRSIPNVDNGIEVPSDTEVSLNTVAFNGAAGILVDGTDNPLVANRVYDNTGLGIDLDPAGPTANDPRDRDPGANDLLNYPVMMTAVRNGTATDVTFRIRRGLASTTFQIEFFASATCAGAGSSNGENSLGTTNVTTGPRGSVLGGASVLPVPAGQFITATATIAGAPLGPTSELSDCLVVS